MVRHSTAQDVSSAEGKSSLHRNPACHVLVLRHIPLASEETAEDLSLHLGLHYLLFGHSNDLLRRASKHNSNDVYRQQKLPRWPVAVLP